MALLDANLLAVAPSPVDPNGQGCADASMMLGGAAVAAGLALAEASWRQQAAAPTGVKPSAKGGSATVRAR